MVSHSPVKDLSRLMSPVAVVRMKLLDYCKYNHIYGISVNEEMSRTYTDISKEKPSS